jgi:hypothetical protein
MSERLEDLTRDCIGMLERYYDRAGGLPNDNSKCLELDKDDMTKWRQVYYPQLSKPEIIKDASYFENPVKNDRYGIGSDGRFCKFEYAQFMYRAYKYVYQHAFRRFDFTKNEKTVNLDQCVTMLEKYVASFEIKGTNDCVTVTHMADEIALWKNTYYPFFVKFGIIPDGEFFGDVQKNPNLGVGADCVFYGKELFHFLYQCYKFTRAFF